MSLIAKETADSSRDPLPAGPQIGICYSIVDLGTHAGDYQGKPTKRHKVNICFELPGVQIETDKGPIPGAKSTTQTLSLNEKASLRKVLESWRGRPFTAVELQGFDLSGILTKPATVNIMHNDKGGDYIGSIMPPMPNVPIPAAVNEPYIYSLDSPGENWNRIPNWAKEEIKQSLEWNKVKDFVPSEDGQPTAAPAAPADNQDDVPF